MKKNIDDLNTEIINEYYRELSKAKKMGWGSWRVFWYGARSSALSAVIANKSGLKLMISTDQINDLDEKVKKVSLFADHIVIRHESLIPSGGGGMMADVPLDFSGYGPLMWIESNKNELNELLSIPHFRSVPYEIDPFLNWTLNNGRNLIEKGFVTYAPFLPPEKVELVSNQLKGININNAFNEANLIPNINSAINDRVLKSIWSIPIPYLENVKTETLFKIKNDYKDSLINFQNTIIQGIKDVDKNQGSTDFKKISKEIFNDIIQKGILELDKNITNLKRTTFKRTTGITVDIVLLSLSFYFGGPLLLNSAALSKTIWDLAKIISDEFKDKKTIQEKPMFILSKIKNYKTN